jgi:nicotinate-nucleotide adenylyltransferase
MTNAGRRVSKIGLLGGSFDPVHVGHLRLAEVALQHLQLDEIRWIPVGQPWQKARQLAPGADRLAMVRAAIAHEPRFVADDIELRRGGPSYTLDTVLALQAARPQASCDWWLILGQDQCANLTSWQCWQELVARVRLAVACRGDAPVDVPLAVQPLATAERLPMPPMPVSSTAVRQRLHAGESPLVLAPDLLPAAVASYIADHHLYAPRGRAHL